MLKYKNVLALLPIIIVAILPDTCFADANVFDAAKYLPSTDVSLKLLSNIFGTIPVAEALLGKGAQLGTVLSFMMAVTTLSLPSVIMLRKAVKPKLLGAFIVICTVGIILVGYGFNIFQYLFI